MLILEIHEKVDWLDIKPSLGDNFLNLGSYRPEICETNITQIFHKKS